jgi:hypothetical protein
MVSKRIKSIKPPRIENLKSEVHWNFSTTGNYDLIFKCHDFHIFHSLSFHIDISKFSYEFFDQSYVVKCIGWSINIFIKNIRNNYRIYSLMIILMIINLASIRCGLFKMSKMKHLTVLLPLITILTMMPMDKIPIFNINLLITIQSSPLCYG